jgi:tRNA nucleotidyltransferase (CCA-adding enzyme)
MHALAAQFRSALQAIEIKDERRDHAIAAHTEIRTYLEADSTLRDWGVETVLIGSYARHTAIWPGKDVDVFTKLTRLSVGAWSAIRPGCATTRCPSPLNASSSD